MRIERTTRAASAARIGVASSSSASLVNERRTRTMLDVVTCARMPNVMRSRREATTRARSSSTLRLHAERVRCRDARMRNASRSRDRAHVKSSPSTLARDP
ncbi:Hypothetical protein A7982_09593 [Minicystis rosea]|nr:Hypothetical protein A7982_09593 [Minicystis rosea]